MGIPINSLDLSSVGSTRSVLKIGKGLQADIDEIHTLEDYDKVMNVISDRTKNAKLMNDLDISALNTAGQGDCIMVRDDVTLDLNGHTLKVAMGRDANPDTQGGRLKFHVYNTSNITVKNGTILTDIDEDLIELTTAPDAKDKQVQLALDNIKLCKTGTYAGMGVAISMINSGMADLQITLRDSQVEDIYGIFATGNGLPCRLNIESLTTKGVKRIRGVETPLRKVLSPCSMALVGGVLQSDTSIPVMNFDISAGLTVGEDLEPKAKEVRTLADYRKYLTESTDEIKVAKLMNDLDITELDDDKDGDIIHVTGNTILDLNGYTLKCCTAPPKYGLLRFEAERPAHITVKNGTIITENSTSMIQYSPGSGLGSQPVELVLDNLEFKMETGKHMQPSSCAVQLEKMNSQSALQIVIRNSRFMKMEGIVKQFGGKEASLVLESLTANSARYLMTGGSQRLGDAMTPNSTAFLEGELLTDTDIALGSLNLKGNPLTIRGETPPSEGTGTPDNLVDVANFDQFYSYFCNARPGKGGAPSIRLTGDVIPQGMVPSTQTYITRDTVIDLNGHTMSLYAGKINLHWACGCARTPM